MHPHLPTAGAFADVHLLAALAHDAEAAGWDGFFIYDQVAPEGGAPLVDPWRHTDEEYVELMEESTKAPVHVLSTMAFPDEWLDQLRAISPRLAITQYTATHPAEVPAALWEQTEVLYSGAVFPDPAHAPRLRWLQLDTSGVDHVLRTPLWQADVAVTTLNGVAPPTMSEYALMMMLAFAHRLPLMLEHQARADWPSLAERWQRFMPRELRGATLGIVGYGSIGRELGRVARALGMRVLGLRRGAAPCPAAPATYRIAGVAGQDDAPDLLYGPDGLLDMLPHCDYVVLIVPYTAATHHLIDRAALHAMKRSAVLVNMARGGVVEEEALIEALRDGWIAGAALDVFEREPPPPASPFWTMENVIISPHVAGFTPRYHERVLELFGANLRRYLAGEPLLNQAQRDRDY